VRQRRALICHARRAVSDRAPARGHAVTPTRGVRPDHAVSAFPRGPRGPGLRLQRLLLERSPRSGSAERRPGIAHAVLSRWHRVHRPDRLHERDIRGAHRRSSVRTFSTRLATRRLIYPVPPSEPESGGEVWQAPGPEQGGQFPAEAAPFAGVHEVPPQLLANAPTTSAKATIRTLTAVSLIVASLPAPLRDGPRRSTVNQNRGSAVYKIIRLIVFT
jgi:hypothetical protein